MSIRNTLRVGRGLLLTGAMVLAATAARADEVRVVSSGGFAAAFKALAPAFEKQTGHTLVAMWGPSMGSTPNAVPQRLARGEKIDVAIMVGYALEALVRDGKASDKTDLARSGIAAAVKAGSPVPDVSTVEALKVALLNAPSIAYSDSASGVYIQNEMFWKLGIEAEVKPRARMVAATPVGEVVAEGGAALGFQQLSELKPVHGITIAGLLPDPAQQWTVFSAGVLAGAEHAEAGRALIRFLASPEAAAAVRDSGMEPMPAKGN